ncbi:extracellular solute-binding protein [Kiritimatiellaeota bacterium B1221]|nr:extracellular solute-binding protein [Kiritimatiellaeota bacterium B1221]
MEASKVFIVRSHVLNLLETGALTEGQQIPPARELAVELDISFVKVQQGIDALCRDGILEAHPRQGVFVLHGWRNRILQDNLSVFDSLHRLPWLPGLLEHLHAEIPDLRVTKQFSRSVLEMKTTHHVLTRHDEYMDLSSILHECYPDQSDFFTKTFEPFRINGRLVGIPFSFSPRVIYCNPKLLKAAGCTVPVHGWTGEEMLKTLEQLQKVLPAEQVINWHSFPYLWMSFVFRAGGQLFNPDLPDPVCIDSKETMSGLRYFQEIGKRVGDRSKYDGDIYVKKFLKGEAALFLADRLFTNQILSSNFTDWIAIPLPTLPGGKDVTAQATDLICVRSSCSSFSLVHQFVRLILSQEVQDYLAKEKAGIPVRRSSAIRGFELDDHRESIMLSEISKICSEFHISSPYPGELVQKGIQRILREDLDLESGCKELAAFARTALGIQDQLPDNAPVNSVFAKTAQTGNRRTIHQK